MTSSQEIKLGDEDICRLYAGEHATNNSKYYKNSYDGSFQLDIKTRGIYTICLVVEIGMNAQSGVLLCLDRIHGNWDWVCLMRVDLRDPLGPSKIQNRIIQMLDSENWGEIFNDVFYSERNKNYPGKWD